MLFRSLLSRRDQPRPPFALALIVGLLALTVATNIPYVGGLVRLVVLILGLGASVAQLSRSWGAYSRPQVADAH